MLTVLKKISFKNIAAQLILLVMLLPQFILAQQKTIPLNRFFTREVERAVLKDSVVRQTGMKPFLESDFDLSQIVGLQEDSIRIYEKYQKYLYTSHLVTIKKDDYFFALDPVFNFSLQEDFADKSLYGDSIHFFQNTRGIQAIGDIGTKFSFQTSFYENQAYLPAYQKSFADSTQVMPGMGRWKQFKSIGYDYAYAQGWLSYKPTKWINIQFGNGKHFIGHGYRSILLSDAAFNYPYIKSALTFFDGKLSYSTIYASLQTLERLPVGEVPESLFKRKSASFNYLSWMPCQYVEVGLFEAVVWQRHGDSGTLQQAMGAYIPVIGVNTTSLGLNNKHNVLVGINGKFKVTKHLMFYGQAALDNPKRKSIAFQAGLSYFDLIIPYLDIQLEYNSMGDFMYASSHPLQSYSHFNQPLGHPAGPGASEIMAIINYRKKRIIGQFKFNQIDQTNSPAGNWRSLPGDDVRTNMSWPTKQTQQFDVSAGFLVNPKTNFQIMLNYSYRMEKISLPSGENLSAKSNIFGLSIKTNLMNHYNDF